MNRIGRIVAFTLIIMLAASAALHPSQASGENYADMPAFEASGSMNETIRSLSASGFDTTRLRDARDEHTRLARQMATSQLDVIEAEFFTLSDSILDLSKRYNESHAALSALSSLGYDDLDKIERISIAGSLIKEGDYETAGIWLEDVESHISDVIGQMSSLPRDAIANLTRLQEEEGIRSDVARSMGSDLESSIDQKDVKRIDELMTRAEMQTSSLADVLEIRDQKENLEDQGMPLEVMEDIYDEALFSYERSNHGRVSQLVKESALVAASATSYMDKRRQILAMLSDQSAKGYITEDEMIAYERAMNSSLSAFMESDIDKAGRMLQDVQHSLLDSGSRRIGVFAGNRGFRIAEFAEEHPIGIAASLLALIIFLTLSKKAISKEMTRRSAIRSKSEIDRCIANVKDLQKSYYTDKSISRRSYDSQMRHQQERLAQATRRLAVAQSGIKADRHKRR